MPDKSSSSSSAGMGCTGFFAALLTVAFVVLKLTHYIDWSWWWVFSPVIIYIVGVILILLVLLIIVVVAALKS